MNVVSVTSETIETALMLKGKYHFSYWDSLMLSAALISNCEVVYSEDMQHNQTIEGRLRILNPFGSCEND